MFGFGSNKLSAGDVKYFEMTVAPVGVRGKVRVTDIYGEYRVEKGDTRESIEAALKSHAIAAWYEDNSGRPDHFIITSFSLR